MPMRLVTGQYALRDLAFDVFNPYFSLHAHGRCYRLLHLAFTNTICASL